MPTGPIPPDDEILFDRLLRQLRAAPASFADADALPPAAGLAPAELAGLVERHAHLTPQRLLQRERAAAAAGLLLNGDASLAAIAEDVGYRDEQAFAREFAAIAALSPQAYRALRAAGPFVLTLPDDFRAQDVLAYHGRDPEGTFERVNGRHLALTLRPEDSAARLTIELAHSAARCDVQADARVSPATRAAAHALALRLLGLSCDSAALEAQGAHSSIVRTLLSDRHGLRVPLAAGPFEALAWAVIGQQINLAFAVQLRRALIRLAGTPFGDGQWLHPTPAQIAALEPADLTALRFSRSKADYLIGAARAVCDGRLPLAELTRGSAVLAEQALRALRGIGPWSTHYTLMRGFGLADCVPVGDSGLGTGLQQLYQLPARPDARQTLQLMAPFAPFRSLATCHLWASLAKAAG